MTVGHLSQNEDGVPEVAPSPRMGTELILTTHNFCDPTTWYSTSARATDEALSDSGDGLTWNSAHPNWVDLTHGKLFDEDAIAADVGHGYAVVVKVNDVAMTPRAPFADSGGDYVVNYTTGQITFASSQAGNAVTASYSYAVDSKWVLQAAPGKRVDIESAEAQFSVDFQMNDAIVFEVWAYNPADPPNKVPVLVTKYKKMVNIIDEAQGSYPAIKACGGGMRGLTSDVYGFPFRYGTIRKLSGSYGVELRVRLENHQAFTGTHTTATFYCTVRDE